MAKKTPEQQGADYARGMAGLSQAGANKDYTAANDAYFAQDKKTKVNSLGQVTDAKAGKKLLSLGAKVDKARNRAFDIGQIARGQAPTAGSGINKPSKSVAKMMALQAVKKKAGK